MATVYSLVCWGGRTGKTVTFTDAGGVVNSTNHGLRTGTRLRFSTTGALPTGLSIVPAYYVGQGADASKFLLYPTLSDAVAGTNQVTFSGTGSGTHTAQSVLMTEYFAQYPGRWGDAGSERCYDSIVSWNSGRAGASALDEEVCELGEGFVDIRSDAVTPNITVPAATNLITSTVDGVRTPAFNFGQLYTGYDIYRSAGGYNCLNITRPRTTIDGFHVTAFSGYYGNQLIRHIGWGCISKNMVVIGGGGTSSIGTSSDGIWAENSSSVVYNCLVYGCLRGIKFQNYTAGLIIANNTVTKCGTGISPAAATNINGEYYNNISIGNTTNWGAITYNSSMSCAGNAGLSGEAWVTGSNSSYTVATTDFVNFPTDMRPASASSPQVDTGVEYYGALRYDIANAERPNYNNGGAEAFDVGCYEFDHGYGTHPATATISLTNIVSGSRVLITRDDTSAVIYNDVPGASLSLSTGYIGNFSVVIRKASESPCYREFSAGGTTVADQTTSIKALQQLDE